MRIDKTNPLFTALINQWLSNHKPSRLNYGGQNYLVVEDNGEIVFVNITAQPKRDISIG